MRAAPLLLAAGLVAVAAIPAAAQEPPGSGVPRFVDETRGSRVKHAYTGDWQYFVGGGVATFDCTGDGLPELYLAGGSKPATFWRNASKAGGKLAFNRLKSPVTDLDSVTGAYPIDIDADGITDLAVLRVGEDVLLRGLGDCAFERANEAWGFEGGDAWTTAFAATWESEESLPTLAFGSYIDLARSNERFGNCADGRLVRPTADGTGYGPAETLTPGFCALSMLFSDWSATGQRDLRISNDRHYALDGMEQLVRMAPGQPPALYTAEDGWQELVIWGMGIGSYDLTGDGRPEVYLTSQGDNKLQTLVDGATGPTFEDIALERGVTAHRPFTGGDVHPSTAWHPAFEDVNNDGLVDLFVAKGNVEAQSNHAMKDPSNLLLQQADGTFLEGAEAAGIVRFDRGRGAAVVDLNADGLLDLVQVNRVKPTRIWRNVGSGTAKKPATMGGWVALRPQQPGANRDAIGGWLEVRSGDAVQRRELTIGGGHVSGHLGWWHVGLGEAAEAEARVIWPDGEEGPWLPVTAGGRFIIERGASAPTPWTPPGTPAG
jgi:hypothetical protein